MDSNKLGESGTAEMQPWSQSHQLLKDSLFLLALEIQIDN